MNLKQAANVAGVAGLLLVWSPTVGSAHPESACVKDVQDFCGSDNNCLREGYAGCVAHGHPDGGNPPPAPDPQNTFNSDPGWQLNKSGPKLKAQ